MDILEDIYRLDLQQYVAWYCQRDFRLLPIKSVENVATFFNWMKLKVRF